MRPIGSMLLALGGSLGLGYWLFRYFYPRHSVMVLDGKVVVITGASSGIGRELALVFAQRGAKVVLAARRLDLLEAIRHEIEPYASEVLVAQTDVTDESQMKKLVQTTLSTFGRIDVLVNNAGLMHSGYLQQQNADSIRQMVDVNLNAAMQLTKEVLPHMLTRREGYIVNVGAMASRLTAPMFSTYNATKSGLAAFTEGLRRELHGTGIQVTLALPVWTRTEVHEPASSLRYLQLPIQNPEEAANGIVEGLVRGDREIVLGGLTAQFSLWVERHFPALVDWYWRLIPTPR